MINPFTMSFSSHMIASLKHNKRKRISAFEKIENFKEGINIQVSFDKKSTPIQLKKIRDKIQAENKRKLKRKLLLFGIGLIVVIYCIGYVKF